MQMLLNARNKNKRNAIKYMFVYTFHRLKWPKPQADFYFIRRALALMPTTISVISVML